MTPAYESHLSEFRSELNKIGGIKFTRTTNAATNRISLMVCNTRKRRALEPFDPDDEFPYPVFALHSITGTFFWRPTDFEHEGFTLRVIDAMTWLKGSIPDRWINCNLVGPETALKQLASMAQDVYPQKRSPFLPYGGF